MKNPPAFPFPYDDSGNYGPTPKTGMTLRDYFAGQALAGFCGNPASMLWDADENDLKVNAPSRDFAAEAYAMADAMLAEREKAS